MLTGIKYKRKDSDFLFRNFIWEKEIAFVLSNSLPKRVECIEKATLDYDYENETFCMSFYSLGHKVEFIFRKNNDTIYDFIRLLELSTDTTEPLILDLYCIDYETNIYIEPLKKNFIRFCITDTKELNQQIKNGKIQRYSYRNSNVSLDVYIQKRAFIRQMNRLAFKELNRILKEKNNNELSKKSELQSLIIMKYLYKK